jgi:hypothetical protein
MRSAKIAGMLLAAVAAGVAIGVWTAVVTYASSCRGLCVIFLEHRFATWQSVLVGVSASAAVAAAELALDSDLRAASLRWIRRWGHDVTFGGPST